MSEKREVGRPWAFPLTGEWGVQFIKDWIEGIVEGTQEIADGEVKQKVFWHAAAGCGKTWIPHLIEEHGYSGREEDLDSLVAAMDAHFKERSELGRGVGAAREGNIVTTVMPPMKKELRPIYPATEEAIRKYGNVCCCALVLNGIIPLTPDLCNCSRQLFNYVFEKTSGKRWRTEIVEAIVRGDENCIMRTTILDEPVDEKKRGYLEKDKDRK